MKFYHLSNTHLSGEIKPAIGASRHGAEDPRAVGQAVVWLSNEPMKGSPPPPWLSNEPMKESPPPQYQYEVDLNLNDPNLVEDELFRLGTQQTNETFDQTSSLGWFFYFGEVPISCTRTWDPSTQAYI